MVFGAGYIVRPFGALVFERIGDIISRKYSFLITIIIMGLSTFMIGVIPSYSSIGLVAPVFLVIMRALQGLAAGDEYGGAAFMSLNMHHMASTVCTHLVFKHR